MVPGKRAWTGDHRARGVERSNTLQPTEDTGDGEIYRFESKARHNATGLLWNKQWESEASKKKILGRPESDWAGRHVVLLGRLCCVLLPWMVLLQCGR